MRKPISWLPWTWRDPLSDWEKIERNLAISTFNLGIVAVMMVIILILRVWRSL